jgi:hypothetical protein
MKVGVVEEDVRLAGVVQRPVQDRFYLLIEALVDAAHLRFGDAAGVAQRINLPRGNADGAGLHHHGLESLVHPAAKLEPVGEEAALPQLPGW